MAPQVVKNPYEAQARQTKALTIADALARHEWTAEEAEHLTPSQWAELAEGIRVNVPSQATVDLVLEIMRRREAAAEADAHLDPFRGLPG